MRAGIELAIKALRIKPEQRWLIAPAVVTLTCIARPPSVLIGDPRTFGNVEKPRTIRELKALAALKDGDEVRLVACTAALHAPAIALLAKHDWFRQDQDVVRAREAAKQALEYIRSGKWLAPKADRGRPAKLREDGITAIAARHYEALTDIEPRRSSFGFFSADAGKPTGPFYRFLKKIFLAAGIATDPRAAIERYQRRDRSSSVDWHQCSWRQIDDDWYFLPDDCDKERSIARIYRAGNFWHVKLIRTTYRAGWAPFAIIKDDAAGALTEARAWVKEEFTEDERFRVFGRWLAECCTLDPMAHETTRDLYAAWSAWAQRAGLTAGSEPKFRSALKARGFVAKREAGTGRSGFLGIRLQRKDYTDDPRYGS